MAIVTVITKKQHKMTNFFFYNFTIFHGTVNKNIYSKEVIIFIL